MLVIGPFQSLVIIDVLLMVASYALIFIAAVRLRADERARAGAALQNTGRYLHAEPS